MDLTPLRIKIYPTWILWLSQVSILCFQNRKTKLKLTNMLARYIDGTGGCDGCLNWKGVGKEYNESLVRQML